MSILPSYIYPKVRKEIFNTALEVETPAIIYDLNHIEKVVNNFTEDIKLIEGSKLYFSMKASNTKCLLKVLNKHTLGVDVGSIHEYNKAKEIGFSNISITSPGLKKKDLLFLTNENVVIDFDSIEQLEYFAKNKPNSDIGIRVSTESLDGVDNYNRFGISIKDYRLTKIIKKFHLKITRLHFHIGPKNIDDLLNVWDFIENLDDMFKYVTSINFGGGLSNLYNDRSRTLQGFILINEKIRNSSLEIKEVIFEPGEAFIINSGYLVTEVLSIKQSDKLTKDIVITDSSPWSYAPWVTPSIINLSNLNNKIDKNSYLIAGNTLYDGDIYGFGEKELITFDIKKIEVGDKLLFSQFGSYTLSNYRSFHLYPRPDLYFI